MYVPTDQPVGDLFVGWLLWGYFDELLCWMALGVSHRYLVYKKVSPFVCALQLLKSPSSIRSPRSCAPTFGIVEQDQEVLPQCLCIFSFFSDFLKPGR